jgi:energy-coupling factor transporter ATP-binding protein EcfA2
MENNIQDFENKLIQLNNQFHISTKIKENLENENQIFLNNCVGIEKELKLLNDTKMLLETLKIHKLKEKKDFILNIVNTALTDIFQDNIKIAIEPQESKGKINTSGTQKFDIIFYQNDIELARNEELLISNGGGIMQVVSMLFKLLIGFIYSKNTFYMFDESFSQLSQDNRIRLSKFLQMFCEKYNFTIVVVSQVLDLDEYADIIYSVNVKYDNKGVRELVLEDSKFKEGIFERNSQVGEEGVWHINIKNFQSIKNIDLRFKGYTIIRGPNNSGKSAILRAVSSILYNSFNVKKYPRKAGGLDSKGNPSKKVLNTEIFLRKTYSVNPEEYNGALGIGKEIGLRYKSSKVSFVIEGEEYYGKNLAAEKLMEKIEELGFKYINMKEFYKNFKGNLKDQTERIASTTQYDGLFLVGSKGNETEKIFNFLFNTENITKAILKVKEDMILLSKNHESTQERILENTSKINNVNNEIQYYLNLYYLTIIENLSLFDTKVLTDYLNNLNFGIDIRNRIIFIYQNNIVLFNREFLKVKKAIQYINDIKNNIVLIDEQIELKSYKIVILEEIKLKINKLEIINNDIQLKKTIETLEFDSDTKLKEIKVIDFGLKIREQILHKLEKLSKLKKYLYQYTKDYRNKNNLELYLEPVLNQLQIIKIKQENLFTECSHCSGKGFILKDRNAK